MAHSHDEHDHPGLQVDVERTGPCVASVRMRVSADELSRSRNRGLSNAARHTRMKGFRPGKVPAALIEKQHGPEIDREITQHFLAHAYEKAVKEHELRPAARPRLDIDEKVASSGEDWEQEFEILLRPEVELGDVLGIQVEGYRIAVTEEEIE